jgi:hypothetical protein
MRTGWYILFIMAVLVSESVKGQPLSGTGDDTTPAEFNKILRSSGRASRDLMDLPSTVSLKNYAPPVRDQGQYGTCVAWSSAYAARTISYAIRTGLNHADSIAKYSFSPGHLYSRIKRQNDVLCKIGSSIYAAMQKLKEEGNALYTPEISDCRQGSITGQDAELYRIKDFMALTASFEKITKNEILLAKKCLAEKKPVLLCLKFFTSLRDVDLNGAWKPVDGETPIGKHALCVVGYDDKKFGGAFEVMNSWGTEWAQGGFFWVTYDQLMKYGVYMVEMMDFEGTAPVLSKPSGKELARDRESNKPAKKDGIPTVNKEKKALQLSGSLDFVLLDGALMPVARSGINTRSLTITDDKPAEFSQYRIKRNYPGGTAFKVKFSTGSPAYVYIFSLDDKKIVSRLFPYSEHISAAINSTDATIYLPAEDKHALLSDIPGKENICVLYSKQPLALDDILTSVESSGELPVVLKDKLGDRLLPLKDVRFEDSEIRFKAAADETRVICFFITLEHF